MSGWQTFEIVLGDDQTVTEVRLVMKGTGSGASGFYLLDARFMGTSADNPRDSFYVRIPLRKFSGEHKDAKVLVPEMQRISFLL